MNPLLNNGSPSYIKNPQYNPNSGKSNFYIPSLANLSGNPIDLKLESYAGKTTISDKLNTPSKGAQAGYFTPATNLVTLNNLQKAKQAATSAPAPATPVATFGASAPVRSTPSYTPPSAAGGATTPKYDPSVTGQPIDPTRLSAGELKDLATRAGQAGLSLTEYTDLVNQNAALNTTDSDAIRKNLGVDEVKNKLFSAPEKTLEDTYQELYKTTGLTDIKKRIGEIDTRLEKKRNDFIKVEGEIKGNPWLSSASRRGRLADAADLALADIGNDLDARQQELDLYDRGVTDIESRLGYIISDRNLLREIDTEKLNYLLNEAERREGLKVTENVAAGLRNIPSFLDGRRQEQLRIEGIENAKYYAKVAQETGVSPTEANSVLTQQEAYKKLNATQKARADSLNNLIRNMDDFKTYYSENPGAFGGAAGNLFGADSGVLETKINGIIFAAAQAEGTGALQEADRAVIEKMIPNPTTFSGAANTLFKGGKNANILRVQDQIDKYSENLRQLGLQPVVGSATAMARTGTPSNTATSYVSSLGIK